MRYIKFALFLFVAHSSIAVVQAAPEYSENEKQKILKKLSEKQGGMQQSTYNQMSDYDKKMFELTRQRVGGYKNIQTQDDIDLEGLTEAQKESIKRTMRNNELIRESIQGN